MVLPTLRVKVALALRLPPSVPETFTLRLPMSSATGVPLKLRLAASNVSQTGSGLPSASVAL
ncbi:hypothetical protein D3C80_1349170 [compost metagenome]